MSHKFAPDLELASSLTLKDPKTAMAMADTHLASDPFSTDAMFIKYQAHRKLGNWQNALNIADEYTGLIPNRASSHLMRADMLYHLDQHHAAIEAAQTAIAMDYKKVLGSEPYRLSALCYAALGDKAKAVAITNQIPELEHNEWFPPIGALPAGTKKQYAAMIADMADHVASGREYTLPKRKAFQESN